MNVTYLFDPLCGWCYGAAPTLDRIRQLDGVHVELAPTGLFAGENARPMDASFAAYAWQNDQRIAHLTGQPFSARYRQHVLGATGTLFDSAPATLAIVAAELDEPSRAGDVLKALQHARYVEGRNNADLDSVASILADAGFDDVATRVQSPDETLLTSYRARIRTARNTMAQIGANGVPTLVVDEGGKRRQLPSSALFADAEATLSLLQAS